MCRPCAAQRLRDSGFRACVPSAKTLGFDMPSLTGRGRLPRLAPKRRARTWGTALDFDTWATIYNRVGVVKGHVYLRRFLSFPFVESFCFCSFTNLILLFILKRCEPAGRHLF